MRLAALILAILCPVWLAVAPALADVYTDAIGRFAEDSYSDTASGIEGVVASGNPLAYDVVSALRDGRLLFRESDKAVVIRDPDGRLRDARTGEPATAAAADLSPVRLNNRVRGAIEAALGALTLRAPDPARRRAAAAAVFKSKSDLSFRMFILLRFLFLI